MPVGDTAPAARAVLTRLYREAGPEARLKMALQMSEDVRRIAEAGARSRMPGASPEEIRRAVARLYLGEELALRVLGPP